MNQTNTNTKHLFISLDAESLGRKDAEDRVIEALKLKIPNVSKSLLKNKNKQITITDGNGKQTVTNFALLVEGAKMNGIVPELDRVLWNDTAPSGTVRAATDAKNFPPLTVRTASRTSDALQPPGCITNDVLSDILEDILFYRQEAARTSSIEDCFQSSFRAYRAYLTSCITAIDAFLNYHRWFFVNNASAMTQIADKDAKIIKNVRLGVNRKLSDWLAIMSGSGALDKTSTAWKTYDAIREERNAFVHVNEPDYFYALEHTSKALNYCRIGVGQLLLDGYKLLGQNPLPPLYSVRYAPMARFVSK